MSQTDSPKKQTEPFSTIGYDKHVIAKTIYSTNSYINSPSFFQLREITPFLGIPQFTPQKHKTSSEKISDKMVGKNLTERLVNCPEGRKGWVEHQKVCNDILAYLFIPPLVGPLEQSSTKNGLQIRDLILDIPYNIGGFWQYIRDKYDCSALIIECKNYKNPIGSNEVTVTTKYYGKKRLGRFGIVLSRKGADESAKEAAKRIWTSEMNILLLCFSDVDLIKMIDLKEKRQKPEKVIDNSIHEFLRSLEK
jgi:hypothetical protein